MGEVLNEKARLSQTPAPPWQRRRGSESIGGPSLEETVLEPDSDTPPGFRQRGGEGTWGGGASAVLEEQLGLGCDTPAAGN